MLDHIRLLATAPRARRLAFSAAVATLLGTGSAGAFQITPITQEFAPSGRGANQSFQVVNDRDEQVTVSVAITTRTMDIDGKEVHEPTDDFTLFPTEIVLPPKGTQVVRARWVGDAAPKSELAYRIIAEETPVKAPRTAPGASIYMTVRYVGSLYVVPANARPNVSVVSAQPVTGVDGKPKLEVIVENKGTAHAILDEPILTVTSGSVTKTLDAAAMNGNLPEENVLAQHQRRFRLTWPEGLPRGPLSAKLSFTPER